MHVRLGAHVGVCACAFMRVCALARRSIISSPRAHSCATCGTTRQYPYHDVTHEPSGWMGPSTEKAKRYLRPCAARTTVRSPAAVASAHVYLHQLDLRIRQSERERVRACTLALSRLPRKGQLGARARKLGGSCITPGGGRGVAQHGMRNGY
jgi:hypothetical protein